MNDRANQSSEDFDLIGYVLGAIEDDERFRIEKALQDDPCLYHELEKIQRDIQALDMELDDHSSQDCLSFSTPETFPSMEMQGSVRDSRGSESSPPPGLARRTSAWIAALPARVLNPLPSNCSFSSTCDWLGKSSAWSLRDFAGLAIAGLIMGMIIIPAISFSREHSREISCQNNLRNVGHGLLRRAESFGGQLMEIPNEECLAVAGAYAPSLLESGFVEEPSQFLCLGKRTSGNRYDIPTFDQMRAAEQDELLQLQEQAGGDYAFNIGYFEDQSYVPPKILNRSQHVVLADAPSINLPGRASDHHGNRGQNVLFEDGRTAFLTTPAIGADSIYENDWAQIAPGLHINDNILAPSRTRLNRSPQSNLWSL